MALSAMTVECERFIYYLDVGTDTVSFLSVSHCLCLEGNDKILLAVSHQFSVFSPPTAKRPKMDSKVSDRFVVVATS